MKKQRGIVAMSSLFRTRENLSRPLIVVATVVMLLAPVATSGQPPEGHASSDAILLHPPGAKVTESAADSIIAEMVARVDEDSLYSFLETLTGEVPVNEESTITTRYAPTDEADLAAGYLGGIFESYGYSVDLHYFHPSFSANVVATRSGLISPQEEVLLVGHYDSVSEISLERAPGADDNGSGVAAIVEAARIMAAQRFERTIKFICFSAEELGLRGSDAYADEAWANGDEIVGVFNLDCVGWNDDYFRIFSNDDSGWLGDLALAMGAAYAPDLLVYHWYCPECTWSDHASFWQYGFPAIVGIETWDPPPDQHHTTGDTLGLLDMPLIANVTRIAIATTATVAGVDTTGTTAAYWNFHEGEGNILHGLVPNPFNPRTTLVFYLPEKKHTLVNLYDVGGRLIRVLTDRVFDAGQHAVSWDGRDQVGQNMGSGVYFIKVTAGPWTRTQKGVLLK
jgi:hypothetical protein